MEVAWCSRTRKRARVGLIQEVTSPSRFVHCSLNHSWSTYGLTELWCASPVVSWDLVEWVRCTEFFTKTSSTSMTVSMIRIVVLKLCFSIRILFAEACVFWLLDTRCSIRSETSFNSWVLIRCRRKLACWTHSSNPDWSWTGSKMWHATLTTRITNGGALLYWKTELPGQFRVCVLLGNEIIVSYIQMQSGSVLLPRSALQNIDTTNPWFRARFRSPEHEAITQSICTPKTNKKPAIWPS